MSNMVSLADIAPGGSACVRELRMGGSMRRRMQDIGLIENTVVECVGRSPCGDPAAYMIRGAVIAIRARDSAEILVEAC